MTDIIYRVHLADNVRDGMYLSLITKAVESMYEDTLHPSPLSDELLRNIWKRLLLSAYVEDWYFGFVSLEQLKFWVYKKEWRNELHYSKFVISKIESKFIWKGDTQAIFNIQKEYQIVETIQLNEL